MSSSHTTVFGETHSATAQLRVALLLLVAALSSLLIPFVQSPIVYGLALLLFLCFVGPILYRLHQGRFDAFETVNVIGLLFFVYFGLGSIWAVNDPRDTIYDSYLLPYIPLAAFYCLIGYLAMLVGYFGPWFVKKAAQTREELPRGIAFFLVPAGLGLLGSLAEAVWSRAMWSGITISGLVSSISQLSPLFNYAWALGWLLVFSGRATRGQRRFVYFFLVPCALAVVLSNLTSKSLIMTIAGVPAIGYWYARRKLPWISLVALLTILIFVVFPFYNRFRLLDPRIPVAERVELTSEIIGNWDAEQYFDQSIGVFKFRLALVNSVAVVVRDVGRWVPYAKGETIFLPAMALFVPRMLWPDKPSYTMGRDFGKTFRVLHVLDDQTSMAVTIPGELYWNFDLPGIVIGMALWGALFRFFYRRFGSSTGLDPARRAIHLVLLIRFASFEAGIVGVLVSAMRIWIVLELFYWTARRFNLLESQPIDVSGEPLAEPLSVVR